MIREEERKDMKNIMPRMEELNRPFWEGMADNKLMIQKCTACGEYQFPPAAFCIHCHSDDVKWVEASGKAKLWSTVKFHKQYLKTQYPELFRVGIAKLEEGPTMFARMPVDPTPEFDEQLQAVFHKTEDGSYLLGFKPAK